MFAGVGAVGRVGRPGLAGAGAHRATFDQSFLGGTLGSGAVFTRASAGWYYNSSGVLVQAGVDVPRFDYDPVTLQLKGLLLEDASTNLILQSGNLANAVWFAFGSSGLPVVTANVVASPDGSVTGARIVYPAVSGTGNQSILFESFAVSPVSYAFSVWLRGNVGGEQTYLTVQDTIRHGSPRLTLTTQWQRFSFITPSLVAGAGYFSIGTDIDANSGETATPAQTIYAWGAQVEPNFVSSYIPTTAAAVTRAADVLSYPIASVTGFSQTQGSLSHEYILEGSTPTYNGPAQLVGAANATDFICPGSFTTPAQTPAHQQLAGASIVVGGTTVSNSDGQGILVPINTTQRTASSWRLSAQMNSAHDGVGLSMLSGPPATLPAIVSLTVNGPMLYQSPLCGQWARRTRYWPRQLSQAELISATQLDGPTLTLDFMQPGSLDPRIVFTRASSATYTDASGVVQTAAMNLLLQSADMSVSPWVPYVAGTATLIPVGHAATSPDGQMTALFAQFSAVNGAGSVAHMTQSGISATASPYTFSVYLKGAVGGEQIYLNVTPDGVTYQRQLVTLTTSWQRYSLTTTPLTAATWYFQIGVDLRDAGQTAKPAQNMYMWGAQLELGTTTSPFIYTTTSGTGAPRWDYKAGVLQGLLIEEARMNVAFPSVPSVAGGWQSFGSTTTPNSGTAPDGSNTTAKLVDDGTNGIHCLAPGFTVASNQPHTVSVYAKAGEIRYLGIRLDNGVSAGFGATFDLQNGTIALSGASDGGASVLATTIQPAGNGFYRCIVSGNLGANTIGRFALINQITPSYGFPGYQSIVGNGCYVWGAQLEQGAFPTSYIPTTSVAVTRAADNAAMPTNVSWFNANFGTLQGEFIYLGEPDGTYSHVTSLTGANIQNDFISLYVQQNNLAGNLVITANGSGVIAGGVVASIVVGAVRKLAIAYQPTTAKGAIGGTMMTLGTWTGSLPVINKLAFFGDQIGYQPMPTGYIRRVTYWNRALSDTEMQQVTT